jgi:hypothetical protein
MEPACRRGDCSFLGDRDNALEVFEFEMIVVAHGHAPDIQSGGGAVEADPGPPTRNFFLIS